MMKYFKDSEFFCSCGCGLGIRHMDKTFLLWLDSFRAALAEPMRISSSIRCEGYNLLIKGAPSSAHLVGQAVDILVPDSGYRYRLIRMSLRCGCRRIGVGDDFVHLDNSIDLPQDVMWHY